MATLVGPTREEAYPLPQLLMDNLDIAPRSWSSCLVSCSLEPRQQVGSCAIDRGDLDVVG